MMHNIAAERAGEPPKKKRGRPSKADMEQRTAEAEARGQVYPSPKTAGHKAPKADRIDTSFPAQDVAASGAPKPTTGSPTEGVKDSASSTPKKRGRPSKPSMDVKKLELEATAAAAGRIGEGVRSDPDVIQETQPSDFAAPDRSLVPLHERVAHAEGGSDIHMTEAWVHESSGTLPPYSGRTESH